MKKYALLFGSIIGLTLLAGCGAETGRVKMDFGTSYKLAKYNQILNPEAEKNLAPVEGFQGQAAAATVEKYQKGFESGQAVAPTYIFSVGGGIK